MNNKELSEFQNFKNFVSDADTQKKNMSTKKSYAERIKNKEYKIKNVE